VPDPAPTAACSEIAGEFCGAANAFVAVAERALARGASRLPDSELQQVFAAAIKLYAARAEAEGGFLPPVPPDKITPTEVVLMVSELLRATNISLFDLAMWYRRGLRP
jgi:hypothetical protein